jgi:DNA-directed RNA polymerase subunit RPC12/RpoP
MIKFKCIYCGQSLMTRDDERGQKGKCPKCNHDFSVPKKPATLDFIVSKSRYYPNNFLWPDPPISQSRFYREKFKWLIPSYDELSLFLTAFTLIMLLAGNPPMRRQIYRLMTNSYYYFIVRNDSGPDLLLYGCLFWAAIAFFLYGFGLSIYHLYTTTQKTSFEKQAMLIFAVVTNICTAFAAGIYLLKESTGWTIVFPIWNLINAGLLLNTVRLGWVDEKCLSDREATYHQIIISLTAIFLIFTFCNFVLNLHWAITFSICIIYTTSFDKALQSVFPYLSRQNNEQAS